jgi:glycerol kinase
MVLVKTTGGVFFVTAFSGLFAPYWRDDSRGTLVGLTQYTDKRHISRSVLEAVSLSTRTILDSMKSDSDVAIKFLKADGGMSNSDTCMQIQADVLGIPVIRPSMRDTTALGAAYAAGYAAGIWGSFDEIRNTSIVREDIFSPRWSEDGKNIIMMCICRDIRLFNPFCIIK